MNTLKSRTGEVTAAHAPAFIAGLLIIHVWVSEFIRSVAGALLYSYIYYTSRFAYSKIFVIFAWLGQWPVQCYCLWLLSP